MSDAKEKLAKRMKKATMLGCNMLKGVRAEKVLDSKGEMDPLAFGGSNDRKGGQRNRWIITYCER